MIVLTDLLHTSPASHLENFQVFLIYFQNCPGFSTIIPEKLIKAKFGMLGADVNKLVNPIIRLYIQGVTGGTDQTSGGCSIGQTIPI